MKKFLLFTLIALCYSALGNSKQLSESVAKSMADNFFAAKSINGKNNIASVPIKLAYKSLNSATGIEGAYYVFNRGTRNGFIIIAGDDIVATPVLGYSENGTFHIDSIPPNMRYWLDEYQRQIEYMQENATRPSSAKPEQLTTSVAPLLGDTRWGQDDPYNMQCPTLNDGSKAAAGCVATAMAQIMYYWRWPETGTGGRSYQWHHNGTQKTLSATFAYSTYEWNLMLPDYRNMYSSMDSKKAVAKLLSDVGISIDMAYGHSSGARTEDVAYALKTYFKYDKGLKYIGRNGFSYAEWAEFARFELDSKRPILYRGTTPTAGHAFVCDGYNEDGYFHINWGWNGSNNGYFLLAALNPEPISNIGYNYSQAMLIGIQPINHGGTLSGHVELNSWTIKEAVCTADSAARIYIAGARNCYSDTLGFDFSLNLYKDWEFVQGYHIQRREATPPKAGLPTSYQYISLPQGLQDGDYRLYPQYKFIHEDTTDFRNMKVKSGGASYFELKVTDGIGTLSAPKLYYVLSSSDIQFVSKVKMKSGYRVKVDVKNLGKLEYCDNLHFKVWDSSNRKVSDVAKFAYLMPDDQQTFTFDMPAIDTFGTYRITLTDENGNVIVSRSFDTEYNQNAPRLSIIQDVTPASYEMVYTDIQASAVIKNLGGYFAGEIEVMVYIPDTHSIDLHLCNYIELEQFEEKELLFKTSFDNCILGKEYTMALRYYAETSKYQIWGDKVTFIPVPQLSAIDEVSTDEHSSPVQYYNLQGVEVKNPEHGIFIRKQGNKVTKVIL